MDYTGNWQSDFKIAYGKKIMLIKHNKMQMETQERLAKTFLRKKGKKRSLMSHQTESIVEMMNSNKSSKKGPIQELSE